MIGDKHHLQIEITNRCNLHCTECPNRFMVRPRNFMTTAMFGAIVEQVNASVDLQTVIMHKDGEPFLHPFFLDLCKIVDDINPSTKIDVYTNGTLLSHEFIESLRGIRNKIHFMITYHKHDHEGKEVDYSKPWAELTKCLAYGPDNLTYTLVTHATDYADYASLKDWQTLWLYAKSQYPKLLDVHLNEHLNHWAGRIEQIRSVHFQDCPYGDGAHLFVGVDGKILPCCMDLEEELSQGYILHYEMSEVFEMMRDFYARVKSRDLPDICKRCLR